MMGVAAGRRDRTLALLAVTLVALVVAVIMLRVAAGRLVQGQERIHQYGGTTWIGDSCFVDKEGTLWCTTSG